MDFIKRIVFLLILSLIFWQNPNDCIAGEINVELIWKFANQSWVEIEVEQGDYKLIFNDKTYTLKAGENFILGQSSLVSFISKDNMMWSINENEPKIILKSLSDGVFKVRTPHEEEISYRGSLSVLKADKTWKLINTVEQEEYLKGVVPIEMSNAWAKDGFEALKAQAVIARTYLLKNMNSDKVITDSPDVHQAYMGKTVEGAASKAVEVTSKEILVDINTKEPISIYYSSHNGGYSEETQNVWFEHDPHYSSEPDPFTKGTGKFIDKWRFVISADVLGRSFGLSPIRDISIKTYPSGRVYEVVLLDWLDNQKRISGGEFVQKFYPYNKPLSQESFLGRLFTVEYIMPKFIKNNSNTLLRTLENIYKIESYIDGPVLSLYKNSNDDLAEKTKYFGIYIFNGSGWGHGVGMSQWGAYNMAKQGYSYEKILYYYYKNSVIEKISP